jgi:hypothetical protein
VPIPQGDLISEIFVTSTESNQWKSNHLEELALMVTPHAKYQRELKEIGQRLGYDSDGQETPLGNVDAKWSETRLSSYLKREKIPIVVFEVVCSEGQKDLRGSLLNMLSAKPALAVLVLIREEIKKHPRGETEPTKWFERIDRYVDRLISEFHGILRLEKWYEDKVDSLYQTYCRNSGDAP